MAFNAGNLVQWSMPPIPPKRGLPQWWGYYTTDTIATVESADYFNLNSDLVIGKNSTWYVGDQIYCVCSDGNVLLQISAISPNVTTTASSAAIPAGSITNAMLGAGIVALANLTAGITPSHVIKFAAQYTTTGGAAAEAIAVAGALATDFGFCVIKDNGTNNVTLLQTAVTNDTLTLTFSADPGADCIVYYQIIRAAA